MPQKPQATCHLPLELSITFADVERAAPPFSLVPRSSTSTGTHIKFIFMCMHAKCFAFPPNFIQLYPVNQVNEFVASLISAFISFPWCAYPPASCLFTGYLLGDYHLFLFPIFILVSFLSWLTFKFAFGQFHAGSSIASTQRCSWQLCVWDRPVRVCVCVFVWALASKFSSARLHSSMESFVPVRHPGSALGSLSVYDTQ